MNKAQGRRRSKGLGYYKNQFERTKANKARRAKRRERQQAAKAALRA